jgi:hypothetical protein
VRYGEPLGKRPVPGWLAMMEWLGEPQAELLSHLKLIGTLQYYPYTKFTGRRSLTGSVPIECYRTATVRETVPLGFIGVFSNF